MEGSRASGVEYLPDSGRMIGWGDISRNWTSDGYRDYGVLQCWEYARCNPERCIAYRHRHGRTGFYFWKEKTLCGMSLYDESFVQYLSSLAGLLSDRVSQAALVPLMALLGR